jgi:dTDP-4-amino-4,6-dideoxygalactose transaminase
VLSFNGNKMITTSGGGALICRNAEDANQIMWYATQARDAYPYYEHTAIGYNYRMSNVCAGIGRGQMTVLDAHIAHHKHVQDLYRELLKDVPGVTLHEQPADERYDSNFWLCAATLDENVKIKGQENAYKEVIKSAVGGAAGVIKAVDCATTECQPNENVEALRVFMLGKKVECRPVWKPMHKQPVYSNAERGALSVERLSDNVLCKTSDKSIAYVTGVSEEIFKVGFCLPAGPYVTDEDVHYIVDSIKEAIG